MSKSTTPATKMNQNPAMNTIGYLVAGGLLIVLLPILPILIFLYIILKITG